MSCCRRKGQVAAVHSVVHRGLVFLDASGPRLLDLHWHQASEVVYVQDFLSVLWRIVQLVLERFRKTWHHTVTSAILADGTPGDETYLRARFISVFETDLALELVTRHLDVSVLSL
jgi:hypothetical protein